MSAAPRLLLIAPRHSYRIAAYLQAAQDLGIEALVASDGKHSLVGALSEGLHVDLEDPDAALEPLLAEARARPLAGVIGTDDSTVELAYRLAEALALPGNPPAAARLARRKDQARHRLQAAGVPVPPFRTWELDRVCRGSPPEVSYPVVVKPLGLSASRGVIRADDPEALRRACERVRAILAEIADPEERGTVLIEGYVPGREVALEGLLTDGELEVLAVFDKPEPLEGPYFEESYYITPSRLDVGLQRRIAAHVAEGCAAYGLRQGPVHAELRVDLDASPESVWLLEIAARTIGGQCARILGYGTGYTLEQLVVAQAIGQPRKPARPERAAGVLMIPIPRRGILRRVEGVLAAQRVPFIEDLEIGLREGYELIPLPEGSSYLGFIFATAPTPAEVETALRAAHAELNVVCAPVWKLHSVSSDAPDKLAATS